MAESSLTIGYPEFRRRVARFLGFNTDTSGWSSNQTTLVDDILVAGYSKFLRADGSYRWSFLTISTTLATVADDYDQDLPDGFGGIMGQIAFTDTTDVVLRQVPQAKIHILRQESTTSSRPELYAVRHKVLPSDGSSGQRQEILFHPPPDDAYTLSYRYRVIPDKLTASDPYAYGGEAHSQTIMAACLAAAELELDGQMGVMNAEFQMQLQVSMRHDAAMATPETYGKNLDHTDSEVNTRAQAYNITYNNTFYTG